MLAIGHVIRNGVIFDLKNWSVDMIEGDDLFNSVRRLFGLLEERQVNYVLVGGVALLQYVEGRNTQDIDLIMALSALDNLPEIALESQDNDFALGEFEAVRLDFLLTSNPLFAHIQRTQAVPMPFAERTIMTATVEGLILLKLYALPSLYRQGDFTRVGRYENDVATWLHSYKPDVTALLDELAPFTNPADMREIRAIVAELQTRFARFGQ